MLVDKDLIITAKEKLGNEAALIIAKDLQIEEFDDKNLKGICPFHGEHTASFIWNPKDNAYKCFGCSKVYGILDHYMNFYKFTFLGAVEKLFSQTNIKFAFGERGVKIQRDYKYPVYVQDENRDIVEKYCATRKISKETLDYCDVQQSNGLLMWNFYDQNDVLLTVKCRPPKIIKKHEQKEWYLPDYDNSPILFNMNKIDPTQPLIITEGQFDTLAVIESGYKNVVSIPGGTENMKWLTTCYDWLESFQKIILFFDNDESGIRARKEATSRLGAWRVSFVELPMQLEKEDGTFTKVKDANEVLYKFDKEKVLYFIDNAQESPVTGVIDLAEVEDFDIENTPGLYTQLKPIDKIIYKFLFGSVVIVTGKRGSGKSSLINQLFVSQPLNQGYDAFIYSGELDPKVLKTWIEIDMIGEEKIKMKNDFVRQIEPESRKKCREWYKDRIWVYNDVSNNEEDILSKAITITRKYGAKIWILDNLMTISIGENDNNIYQKQKDFMVKLINLAKLYNVLIVLVQHPRKTSFQQNDLIADDIGGSGSLSNLAQYLLSVHRFSETEKNGEKDTKGNYKKGHEPIEEDVSVEVMKNRYTGKLGKALLFFNYPDYRFYSNNAELRIRYKWNDDTSPISTQPPKENKPDFMAD